MGKMSDKWLVGVQLVALMHTDAQWSCWSAHDTAFSLRFASVTFPKYLVTHFSRVLHGSTPRFVGLSVRPLVRPLVHPLLHLSLRQTLLFKFFCGLWPHCSCPNDQVTSNMAPAHPHATRVAMYLALFITTLTRMLPGQPFIRPCCKRKKS